MQEDSFDVEQKSCSENLEENVYNIHYHEVGINPTKINFKVVWFVSLEVNNILFYYFIKNYSF